MKTFAIYLLLYVLMLHVRNVSAQSSDQALGSSINLGATLISREKIIFSPNEINNIQAGIQQRPWEDLNPWLPLCQLEIFDSSHQKFDRDTIIAPEQTLVLSEKYTISDVSVRLVFKSPKGNILEMTCTAYLLRGYAAQIPTIAQLRQVLSKLALIQLPAPEEF